MSLLPRYASVSKPLQRRCALSADSGAEMRNADVGFGCEVFDDYERRDLRSWRRAQARGNDRDVGLVEFLDGFEDECIFDFDEEQVKSKTKNEIGNDVAVLALVCVVYEPRIMFKIRS